MKEIFSKKSVLLRIALTILLVPVLLATATFLLSNEIEGALKRQSRILYSGPDDLRAFIEQYNSFYFIHGDSDKHSDIALEINEGKASVYFSPEKISSIIAYERLSEALLRYADVSAQGESVEVYYELSKQNLIRVSEGGRYSLNHTVRFLLASIVSLLAFVILISGNGKIARNKALTFIFFLFFESALITASIFVFANYMIPLLLSDGVANFIFISDKSIPFVLILSGFVLRLSAHILKTCVQDFLFIPVFLVFCAIFMNISAFVDKMPDWSYFLPILNLLGIFIDATMNRLEIERLIAAIAINAAFSAVCLFLSLKAAKDSHLIL